MISTTYRILLVLGGVLALVVVAVVIAPSFVFSGGGDQSSTWNGPIFYGCPNSASERNAYAVELAAYNAIQKTFESRVSYPSPPPTPQPPTPTPAPTPTPTPATISIPTSAATCTSAYFCLDSSTLYLRDNQCTETFVQSCSNGCSQGSCVVVPPPPLPPSISINLQAIPSLVALNATTQVSWSSTNVDSCSVTGDNGDSFTGTSGTKTSSSIVSTTVYTLSCTGDAGTQTDTATVRLVPAWQEF
ncbi:MAG: hypothetical protein JKX80_02200 [Candidatus Pacebacteria bacterium]|nr:hypothetical protein [Candidatus Paceibacterota bacterium]